MKRHIIELDGLEGFIQETEVEYAGSYGKGEHKSLKITLAGEFRVYQHRVLVWNGNNADVAVEKYNEI